MAGNYRVLMPEGGELMYVGVGREGQEGGGGGGDRWKDGNGRRWGVRACRLGREGGSGWWRAGGSAMIRVSGEGNVMEGCLGGKRRCNDNGKL